MAQDPAGELYLEVFVNGQPKNLITRFTDLGDGLLSADAVELRNSGILPDGAASTGEVRLDQIPGLGWRLSEPDQTISFIVPESLLAPYVIGEDGVPQDEALLPQEEETGPRVDTGYGLVLNYALDAATPLGGDGGGVSFGGNAEARLFMPLGVLNHNMAFTSDPVATHRLRRLETYWRSTFAGRAVQVQLGDLVTRGPGWSRPVRLGGAMVERNFSLRPDLVTIPLPSLEGTAAVPSTVEVFSGAVRTFSAEVPQGPFTLNGLPVSAGAGVANVLIRDAAGRETRIDMPYFVSADLLRKGLLDFAVSAGRPRLGAGSDGDHYGPDGFGTATLRYGLTDALTVEAHAEGGPGIAMAGAGASFRTGHFGTIGLHYAHSRAGGDDGRLAGVSASMVFGEMRAEGRLQRSRGRFADIAAVTAIRDPDRPLLSDFPRQLAHLSLTMPMPGGRSGSGGLFYSQLTESGGEESANLGLSYSVGLPGQGMLSLNALVQRGAQEDRVLAASVSLPLSGRRQVGAGIESRRGGMRQGISASGRSPDGRNGWDWRAQAERHPDGYFAHAQAGLSTGRGRIEMALRTGSAGGHAAGLRLDGALVAAGGGVFLSQRVNDAFAVVDAGAPGVEVRSQNRPVGRTGRGGKLLVPDLRAYEDNRLSIDPASLPLDAVIASTEQSVRPAHRAGARVDFGIETDARTGLIELVDGAGQPLMVGGRVLVNGADEDLLVGFDGQVYAAGLQERNEVQVSYPGGRGCVARFDYRPQPGTMIELTGIPCLEE